MLEGLQPRKLGGLEARKLGGFKASTERIS